MGVVSLSLEGTVIKCIVPRISDDEFTFATLDATVIASIQNDDDLYQALKKAVKEWVEQTAEGHDAWMESSQDLNIGDLLGEDLTEKGALFPYLMNSGILRLEIDTFSSIRASSWDYDDRLYDPSDGEEE